MSTTPDRWVETEALVSKVNTVRLLLQTDEQLVTQLLYLLLLKRLKQRM